jgi:hypothetical protein
MQLYTYINIYIYVYIAFFSFIVVMDGVHFDIYTGSYNVSNISYMNYPVKHSPSSPTHPIPGEVSTGIIFAFIYMCTHFIAPYSPSYLFFPT